jgi:putative transposase
MRQRGGRDDQRPDDLEQTLSDAKFQGVGQHPALDISVLIDNMNTASARRTRNRFAEHLAPFYREPLFWSRVHFVGRVGGATLETVRAWVDAQSTEEHARKSAAKKAKAKPFA